MPDEFGLVHQKVEVIILSFEINNFFQRQRSKGQIGTLKKGFYGIYTIKPQKSVKSSKTSAISTQIFGVYTALTGPWMGISDFMVMLRLPSNQYLTSVTWPK